LTIIFQNDHSIRIYLISKLIIQILKNSLKLESLKEHIYNMVKKTFEKREYLNFEMK